MPNIKPMFHGCMLLPHVLLNRWMPVRDDAFNFYTTIFQHRNATFEALQFHSIRAGNFITLKSNKCVRLNLCKK